MSEVSLNQRSKLYDLLRRQALNSVTNADEFWPATDQLDEKKYKYLLALFYNYKTAFALRELEDLFIGQPSAYKCHYCDVIMEAHERHHDGELFASFSRCNQPACGYVMWHTRKPIKRYYF